MKRTARLVATALLAATFLWAVAAVAFSGVAHAAPAVPYVVWWGDAKTLNNVNMVAPGTREDIGYWRQRGVVDAGHVGLGPADWGYVEVGQPDLLRRKMEERVAQGFQSITLEIERDTDAGDAAALKEFKAAHPDIFVSAWLLGLEDSHPFGLLKEGVDLFMPEVYTDYGHTYGRFDSFVDIARREGILSKSVFAVSVVGVDTLETERQLAYIRKTAPEMPGIAFFHYRGEAKEIAADALSKKYFVDPLMVMGPGSLSVTEPAPGKDTEVTLVAKVRNIGYNPAPVAVDFYDGDPDAGGEAIAKGVGSQTVAGQGTAEIRLTWRPTGGPHRVVARLAPSAYQPLTDMRQADVAVQGFGQWWNPLWRFRSAVSIKAPASDDSLVAEVPFDGEARLLAAGAIGDTLDPYSVRVVEYGKGGEILGESPADYDEQAQKVVWRVSPGAGYRSYYIYFDGMANGPKVPAKSEAPVSDANTYDNGLYRAALDPHRGYAITSMVPAGSQESVLASPWDFRLRAGGVDYRQTGDPGATVSETVGTFSTRVEVSQTLGGYRLRTTYTFYAGTPAIKIERDFGGQGAPIDRAMEETRNIPERGGTVVYGKETATADPLLQDNVHETYFGGPLGTGNDRSQGWLDWTWPGTQPGGFGVAMERRWRDARSDYQYDITRHYDDNDYVQVWYVHGGGPEFPAEQHSALYLVPHSGRSLSATAPTTTGAQWQLSHQLAEPVGRTEELSLVDQAPPVARARPALQYVGDRVGALYEPASLTARLVDQNGSPLADRVVTFTLAAQQIAARTDGNGIAQADLMQVSDPGSHELAAGFPGDAGFQPIETRTGFVVTPEAVTVRYVGRVRLGSRSGYSFPVKIVSQGTSSSGMRIRFVLAGKARGRATLTADAAGRAVWRYRRTLPRGRYALTVTVPGNACRLPATTRVSLLVK